MKVQILNSNEIIVRWLWPDNELVATAFVLWRPDRYPSPPHRWSSPPPQHENGTLLGVVTRNSKDPYGMLRLAYSYKQAYVQVFMAIADYTQQRANWFYSRGNEPTSRNAVSLARNKPRP